MRDDEIKAVVLHPFQYTEHPMSYMPFSSKVVGWALSRSGIESIKVIYRGVVLGEATYGLPCHHETAIQSGGLDYNINCGFEFDFYMIPKDNDAELIKFELEITAKSGEQRSLVFHFSGNSTEKFPEILKRSLANESISLKSFFLNLRKRSASNAVYYILNEKLIDNKSPKEISTLLAKLRWMSNYFSDVSLYTTKEIRDHLNFGFAKEAEHLRIRSFSDLKAFVDRGAASNDFPKILSVFLADWRQMQMELQELQFAARGLMGQNKSVYRYRPLPIDRSTMSFSSVFGATEQVPPDDESGNGVYCINLVRNSSDIPRLLEAIGRFSCSMSPQDAFEDIFEDIDGIAIGGFQKGILSDQLASQEVISRENISLEAHQRNQLVYINSNGITFDPALIKSALVIKIDAMGDVITAIKPIEHLRKIIPNAHITLLATPYTGMIAHALGIADEILTDRNIILRGDRSWDLATELRIDDQNRNILSECKAFVKIGFRTKGMMFDLEISRDYPEPGVPGQEQRIHISEQIMGLIERMSISNSTFSNNLRNPIEFIERWKDVLSPLLKKILGEKYCVVQVGPDNDVRSPTVRFMQEAISEIHQISGLRIVLIGVPGEAARCSEIADSVAQRGIPVVNLAGALTDIELMVCIAGASSFVGIDSGPKHLAAMFGIPGVSIHGGRHSPRVWGSFSPRLLDVYSPVQCSPCIHMTREQCHRQMECQENLSPKQVASAFRLATSMENI